ncbi:MAG: EamA family transporter, partial [Alistipes sp.]|nr:EamA family transporter [Candidatus Minthomonas equi]
FVLLGAIIIFDERLNLLQWGGVIISLFSIYLLGVSSRKNEGIDFKRNKAIFFVMAATIFGAASALYDRFILTFLNPVFSQGWFTLYEFLLMCMAAAIIWFPHRKETGPFH